MEIKKKSSKNSQFGPQTKIAIDRDGTYPISLPSAQSLYIISVFATWVLGGNQSRPVLSQDTHELADNQLC